MENLMKIQKSAKLVLPPKYFLILTHTLNGLLFDELLESGLTLKYWVKMITSINVVLNDGFIFRQW